MVCGGGSALRSARAAFLKAGDVEGCALNALHAGGAHREWKLKAEWESDAMHGERMRTGGIGNLSAVNAMRKQKRHAEDRQIREQAIALWRERPELRRRSRLIETARILIKRHGWEKKPATLQKKLASLA